MKRSYEATLLAAYAGVTLVLALHHEPWRDEADSWLLVNNRLIYGTRRRVFWMDDEQFWLYQPIP